MASKAGSCRTYCKFGKIGDLSDHHDKGLRKLAMNAKQNFFPQILSNLQLGLDFSDL